MRWVVMAANWFGSVRWVVMGAFVGFCWVGISGYLLLVFGCCVRCWSPSLRSVLTRRLVRPSLRSDESRDIMDRLALSHLPDVHEKLAWI